jgi:hypothetical protein
MNIKDLEVSKELTGAECAAIRGGDQGNSAVSTIGQLQNVYVPVMTATGAGSSGNTFVDVDAYQSADQSTRQNNGDRFSVLFGLPIFAR